MERCEVVFGAISPSVTDVAAGKTQNEVAVDLILQGYAAQAADPESDFVAEDTSYSQGPYDEEAKAAVPGFVDELSGEHKNAYPSRANYSSRVYFVLADLIQRGFVYYAHPIWDRYARPAFICRLTPKGISLAEDPEALREHFPTPSVDTCFVIMSFSADKRLADFYRFGIKSAVEDQGYVCRRVDEIEHNHRITDRVLSEIEAARFVVADLTEARPNCYYELGYAHRASKEAILSIHKDTPIHFDVKDYNFIVYESASELHDRLSSRIEKSIGKRAKESA